ncbi:MAG: hypothetical protein V1708_01190 [Candidatus Micrarchaeota archaeon]
MRRKSLRELRMAMDFDLLKALFPPKKVPIQHKLKWNIPEARLTAPVEDAEKTVALVKKQAIFSGGGEFVEEVHAKEYGQGVYAYYVIRTDKRTQEETVHFDGYMLDEEDRLGMDVSNAATFAKDLEMMGYKYAFVREVEVWSLRMLTVTINVFSVTGLGDFVEVALPATKFAKQREKDEKMAEKFFEKLKVDKKDIFPTDLITLQMASMQEEQEKSGR